MLKPKQISLSILVVIIMITGFFSVGINSVLQTDSIIQTGYYQIFNGDTLIANVKNFDDIQLKLLTKYGNKAQTDIYFGKDIAVEYISYDKPVQLSNIDDIIDELDIHIPGIKITTSSNKEFITTSYRDWQHTLADVVQFVKMKDDFSAHNKNFGEVQVAENFYYEQATYPIDEVLNDEEMQNEIIFSNVFDIKMDEVQEGDSIADIAARNNISVEQLTYTNKLTNNSLLVPGTKLNVETVNYALNFSYPIIENIDEEVAFEIEYQDDDSKYVGEEEIIQEGQNGRAHSQYLSYIVNGESIPGERLQYDIFVTPVKQIVKRGTKIRSNSSATSSGADAPFSNIAGFIWPTIGICISAEYGWYEYGAHNGLDIAGSTGESIWAVAAGTVESAEFLGAWGNQVVVNHHNGLKTRYAHMNTIGVNKGQTVTQGQYVGGMGRTGMVDGVHLHLEVMANGTRVNPRPYLPAGGPKAC